MKKLHSAIFSSLTIASTFAFAQTTESAKSDIRATYSFDPTNMSFDEQAKRAPSLSELWSRYSKLPKIYHDALESELLSTDGTGMLYCDGGMLFLNKTKSKEDRYLGLKSIEKCSLAEIQQTPYFYTLHSLALQGVDTFDLSSKILEKPRYSVFIVQHSLNLGQDYAFLYPLMLQEEDKYVPRLIKRLNTEKDGTAQKSLARALFYAATTDAEAALRAFLHSPNATSLAKDALSKWLAELNRVRKGSDREVNRLFKILALSPQSNESELRTKRRSRMRAISDEALHDLDLYTVLIYRTLPSGK